MELFFKSPRFMSRAHLGKSLLGAFEKAIGNLEGVRANGEYRIQADQSDLLFNRRPPCTSRALLSTDIKISVP